MKHHTLPSPARGFTLLEIIVVVLVFSVMAAMAYGGLNSVLKTQRGIEESMARTADLQRAFLRLRGDFQNLRDRATRDAFGDEQAPFTLTRDGQIDMVRGGWRSPVYSGRSSLERVSYQFKDGVLRRLSFRSVDLPQQAEPADLALLKEVEEVRWRFLDGSDEWQTEWPPRAMSESGDTTRASQSPPRAVELTLSTKDWGELRFLFRTPLAGLSVEGAVMTREGLLSLESLGLGVTPPVAQQPTENEAPQTPSEPQPEPETPPASEENSSGDGT